MKRTETEERVNAKHKL